MIRAPFESWECPLSNGTLQNRKFSKFESWIMDSKTEKISSRAFEWGGSLLWFEFTGSGSEGHLVISPLQGWYTVFFLYPVGPEKFLWFVIPVLRHSAHTPHAIRHSAPPLLLPPPPLPLRESIVWTYNQMFQLTINCFNLKSIVWM